MKIFGVMIDIIPIIPEVFQNSIKFPPKILQISTIHIGF